VGRDNGRWVTRGVTVGVGILPLLCS